MAAHHPTRRTTTRCQQVVEGFGLRLITFGAVCAGLLVAAPTRAASLESVDQSVWWDDVSGLPSYVNMFLYVPDQVLESPPIVVAPHHCQGTGPGTFSEMSSLVSLADQNGFIMIFPEATGQNCWDAGSDRSLTHDGGGDTHAVVQMVRYTLATYGGNRGRVYSVGGSSGAIMTEALLGVYPDVFMAGVSLMGVPCGCWAEGYNDVVGNPSNGTGQWSGPCAGGEVKMSGQEWGDLVRSFFPGYSGHRPRLQHWHGTADTVLDYTNMAEDIKQWANLLELSESPTGTDTPANGTTRQYWTNACGYTVYETFALDGVGHSVPFDGDAVAEYFGLGDAAGQDPEAAACPGVGGDGGMGGVGGATSTSAAGASSTGMGGAGGSGTVDAGASQTGDASTTTGSTTQGSGPVSGSVTNTTGNDATSGTTGGASSGTTGQGGGFGSDSGSSGVSPNQGSDSQGCACGLIGRARNFGPGGVALLVIGIGLMFGRRWFRTL